MLKSKVAKPRVRSVKDTEKLLAPTTQDFLSKETLEIDGRIDYLTSDQNDVLEGYVLSNKDKSDAEIFNIIRKDDFFNDVSDVAIKTGIEDTKMIYSRS